MNTNRKEFLQWLSDTFVSGVYGTEIVAESESGLDVMFADHNTQAMWNAWQASRDQNSEIKTLKAELRKYKAAAEDFVALINESEGVGGLHENGELADWGSLLAGGYFEGWLLSINELPESEKLNK